MKWLKLHNEIIHDPKVRALAFEDRWHFVAVLCLMNDGTLDEPAELRDELVSVALGLHGIDLEKCKDRLVRMRLIGRDWKPVAWERRQASTDPKAAVRMRAYRDKKQAERNVTRNVTVTLRGEEEVEVEEEYKNRNRGRRFTPPTLSEVSSYVAESGLRLNPEAFIAYYESKGWLVGKVRMKDWKAAARGWSSREKSNGVTANPTGTGGRSSAAGRVREACERERARLAAEGHN